MERKRRVQEDKVCRTCGHTGFADSIATCSQCKVSHEHTYCMPSVPNEVTKGWRCEECLGCAATVSNRYIPVTQAWHKRTSRKIVAGKVKFITNEEVVTLASGKRLHGGGNPNVSGDPRTPISWKRVTPTLPSLKEVEDPFRPNKGSVYASVDCYQVNKEKGRETAAQVCKIKTGEGKANSFAYNFSSTCTKLNEVRFDIVDSLRADEGQICIVDKHIDNKTHREPKNDCLLIEDAANASLAIHEERDLHTQRDVNVLPVNDSGTALCSIMQLRQISSPLKLVINSEEKNLHAVETCWSGAFDVLDSLAQFHGTVLAHFPCQVSPKVYDISKHLPGTLQFKMLSRESVWPKIFMLDTPTKDDVALYFRCEVERHKENYAHFIQHIDSHDYALQGCVEDVELLLFTSAQLQIDSENFKGAIYLWGVFRHLKKKKASLLEEKVVSCSPSIEREVDMDIDMVGGCAIGKIDVPIKLEDIPSGFPMPIQRSPVSFSLKNSKSHYLGTPPGFPIPTHKSSVPSPAGKHHMGTPPGFSIPTHKRSVPSLAGNHYLDTPPGFPIPAHKSSVPSPAGKHNLGTPPGFSIPTHKKSVPSLVGKHYLDTPPGFPIPAHKSSVASPAGKHNLGTPPGFPIPAQKWSVPSPTEKPSKPSTSSNTTRN